MTFEYSVQKTFNESLDVVDAGNCALKCSGGKLGAYNYYVIVKTIMGKTHMIKYGPVIPDIPMLVENFNVTYNKNDYKESFIFKEIDKFINECMKFERKK